MNNNPDNDQEEMRKHFAEKNLKAIQDATTIHKVTPLELFEKITPELASCEATIVLRIDKNMSAHLDCSKINLHQASFLSCYFNTWVQEQIKRTLVQR